MKYDKKYTNKEYHDEKASTPVFRERSSASKRILADNLSYQITGMHRFHIT